MWALLGAVASSVGAVVGAFVGIMSASPCTEMLCWLGDLFYGAVIGWGVGIVGAITMAATGNGSGSDRVVRALFVVVGVAAVPMTLVLLALIQHYAEARLTYRVPGRGGWPATGRALHFRQVYRGASHQPGLGRSRTLSASTCCACHTVAPRSRGWFFRISNVR